MIARRLLAVQVTSTVAAVLVMALSLVAYLPFAAAAGAAAILVAVGGTLAAFTLLDRREDSGLSVRRIGRIPVGARLDSAFKVYRRAASPRIKRWAVATVAAAAGVLFVGSVSGRALPGGNVSRADGGYIETVHGAVTAHLTRAAYRDEQMTNMRFALTAGTVITVFGAVVSSGLLGLERRRHTTA